MRETQTDEQKLRRVLLVENNSEKERTDKLKLLENPQYKKLKDALLAASDYRHHPHTGVLSWFRHGSNGIAQTREFVFELHKLFPPDLIRNNHPAEYMNTQIESETLTWLNGSKGRKPTGYNNSSRLARAYERNLLPQKVTHVPNEWGGFSAKLFNTPFNEMSNDEKALLRRKVREAGNAKTSAQTSLNI